MDDNDLDEINRLLIKIKKDNNNNESMEHIINLTTIFIEVNQNKGIPDDEIINITKDLKKLGEELNPVTSKKGTGDTNTPAKIKYGDNLEKLIGNQGVNDKIDNLTEIIESIKGIDTEITESKNSKINNKGAIFVRFVRSVFLIKSAIKRQIKERNKQIADKKEQVVNDKIDNLTEIIESVKGIDTEITKSKNSNINNKADTKKKVVNDKIDNLTEIIESVKGINTKITESKNSKINNKADNKKKVVNDKIDNLTEIMESVKSVKEAAGEAAKAAKAAKAATAAANKNMGVRFVEPPTQ